MKVYKKIVWDKDMNVIEEESYDYNGPVTECKGGGGGNPIKKVFKKVSKIFKKIIKKITSFVGDVFGFVLKPFGLPELGGFDADNIASGVKLTKPGTNIGIPVVYGYRRVGAIPIFAETDGSNNRDLYVVYAVCEGEIQGFRKIFVDGHFVGVSPSGTYYTKQTQFNGGGRYAGNLQFECMNGTETQPESQLMQGSPTWRSKQRTMPGLAYVAFKFSWFASTQEEVDANPYGGGLPQVEFELNGRKIYDVRTHSGGLDLANDYANLTKTFTTTTSGDVGCNPANIVLDYLMNPRYGAGFKKEEINATSFKIAADKLAQTVTFDPNLTSNNTGRVMDCNAVLDTTQKILDNCKTLLSGARSYLPYVEGRYKLRVEDGGHPTDITSSTVSVAFDITEDHLVGPVTLSGEQKDTKYNQVIVNYIDPMMEFSSQQVFFSTAGDKAIDDDEDLTGEFTFETLTNRAIAQDIARMIYKKSRAQRQIQFVATQELLNVEVGDIVRVTDTILGLNQQTFRVMGLTLELNGNVKIEAVEHDATVYPHVATEQQELPPPVFLPNHYFNKVRTKPQEPVNTNYQNPDTTPPEREQEPAQPIVERFIDPTIVTVDTRVYENKSADSFLFQNKLDNAKSNLTPSPNGLNGAVHIGNGPDNIFKRDLSTTMVPIVTMAPTFPDGDANGIEISVLNNDGSKFFRNYDFRESTRRIVPNFTNSTTQSGQVTPLPQGKGVPSLIYELLRVPLYKGSVYTVRYVNFSTRKTYLTGGSIGTWSGFSTHTYTKDGNTISNSGLEGLINYLAENFGIDGSKVDLGG